MRRFQVAKLALVVFASLLATAALTVGAQQMRRDRPKPQPSQEHTEHGTPKGWKFTLPRGDAARGREIFVKLECYSCHEVKGESFPAVSDKERVGPELASMAAHHESEFFAESIVNPSAVIDNVKGYRAPDGSSRMPSFNDSMTVQEMIDLVAYLKSLKPPAGGSGEHKH